MKVTIDVRPFPPAVRADYWAALIDPVLIIVDANLGNMSVTNDLEAVLLEIFRNLVPPSIDYTDLDIRYRDTMDEWDSIAIERVQGFDGTYTAEVLKGDFLMPPDLDLFKREGLTAGSATVSLRQ